MGFFAARISAFARRRRSFPQFVDLGLNLGELLGTEIEVGELTEAENAYAAQVSEAVASDADTQAYVEELERRADTIENFIDDGELPTGESLAAELTRFLRERESGDGPKEQ